MFSYLSTDNVSTNDKTSGNNSSHQHRYSIPIPQDDSPTHSLTHSLTNQQVTIFNTHLPQHQPIQSSKQPNRARTKKSSTTPKSSQNRIVMCDSHDPRFSFTRVMSSAPTSSNESWRPTCYYQGTCLGPFAIQTPSEYHPTLRYQPCKSRFPSKNLIHNLRLD